MAAEDLGDVEVLAVVRPAVDELYRPSTAESIPIGEPSPMDGYEPAAEKTTCEETTMQTAAAD